MMSKRVAGAMVLLVAMLGVGPSASAATPGVGDVSNAMRYDVAGPYGAVIADLSDNDDASFTLASSFPLNFFGVVSGGVCVSTNGGVYLVPTATDSCSDRYDRNLEYLALDSGASMIAALAGDIDNESCDSSIEGVSDGWGIPCEIYFGTTTIAGRDAVVVTWYRMPMIGGSNDPLLSQTFQIVLIKRATGDDTVGWDFDIEFNYGTVADPEEGYSSVDPTNGCDSATDLADCRYGVGWANFIPGAPNTADAYELFATTPISELMDGGPKALTANRLNSTVNGRYTFGMVGGVTVGFAVPTLGAALAATGPRETTYLWGGVGVMLVAVGATLLALSRRLRS